MLASLAFALGVGVIAIAPQSSLFAPPPMPSSLAAAVQTPYDLLPEQPDAPAVAPEPSTSVAPLPEYPVEYPTSIEPLPQPSAGCAACGDQSAGGYDSSGNLGPPWFRLGDARWWRPGCDLPQRWAYPPPHHGNYYLMPYGGTRIREQQQLSRIWKGDPRDPYSSGDLFTNVYGELEKKYGVLNPWLPQPFTEEEEQEPPADGEAEPQPVPDLPPADVVPEVTPRSRFDDLRTPEDNLFNSTPRHRPSASILTIVTP